MLRAARLEVKREEITFEQTKSECRSILKFFIQHSFVRAGADLAMPSSQ